MSCRLLVLFSLLAARFNLRVLECRLAAMLLAKRLQDSSHNTSSSSDQGSSNSTNSSSSLNWQQVKMLNEVESSLLNIAAAGSGLGTTDPTGHTAAEQCPRCTQVQGVASQILQAVKQFLPHTPCQLQQVCAEGACGCAPINDMVWTVIGCQQH